jgi:HK97 family phage prohead protease
MENQELRYTTELRAGDEKGLITGTAIVFDVESHDLGGFKEVVKRMSVTDELLMSSDIIMKYNHNDNFLPLARKKAGTMAGTLKVDVDERGVNFQFRCKQKDMPIFDCVQDGTLDACSFAFRLKAGQDSWEKRSDGTYLRTINGFDTLADFSICPSPAYPSTILSVNTRGLDELKAQEKREQQVKEGLDKDKKEREDEEERNKKHLLYMQKLKAKYLK